LRRPGDDAPEGSRPPSGSPPPPPPPDPGDRMVACDLCGEPVLERHCKMVCHNCGYTRDCSDP
jgi:hypothetical protein